ncbi:MAG: hypothetical protein US62_C0027G0007 [Candidatus Woesebacteria bacterium GW2011_GWA1_37_8]|uniref:Uncharacterized protein n=2 Tax=Candidatus Woeseibacteriota TaxID=1752722 RepID=A0A0G0NNQ0_9BACT|nr:MAG: hypothetical protein US39_C0007G0008 [Microgenomates group bacterium GW2011_GWC1_37_12b]KKQ44352.1 MAG: hypothetical protein US62_C0027G0007 [Candidatus Woesebacteria bacterium GW2011_GWA1_37_8]KKQ87539.1 MAG: hypothetical protein UT10_C0004G0005 [Candidatus Woesebacteria bacterium GW2011_GWB1_38_8b]
MAGVKKTKTVSSKAGDNLNLLPDFLKILFSDKNPKTAKNVILAGITIVITTLAIFLYMLFASRNQWGLENKDTDYLSEIQKSNEAQGSLPQFFPSDFPVFDGATLKNNWTTKSTNVTGVSIIWETDQLPTKVFNFYFTQLISLDYKTEVISQTENSYTLSFEKPGLNGFVGITQAEGKTLISVTLGIKNEGQ